MGGLIALFLATFALGLGAARADPDLPRDVSVADLSSGDKVNGLPCKNPSSIGANNFFFAGLAKPGFFNDTVGRLSQRLMWKRSQVSTLSAFPSLALTRRQWDQPSPYPPTSNRGSVRSGRRSRGCFITTSNVLISKWIKKGEIFVFPKGLVHFQKNVGRMLAAVITAFDSQFPGTQSSAATLFAASPTVPDDVLSKAFQIGRKEVQKIKSKLAPKK